MAEQDRARLEGMITVVQDRLALPGRSSTETTATAESTIVQGVVATDEEDDTGEDLDPMPVQRYSARRITERIEASR